MSDFNKIMATSSPPKNFICPFCNRPFIFARSLGSHIKVHRESLTGDLGPIPINIDVSEANRQNPVAPPQPENAPSHGRSAPRNRCPRNYHPYTRPLEVSKGGDEQPSATASDFVGNYPMPNPTMPTGGPTEIAKSFEGTVTNPIDVGEEVSSKEEEVDLELKL